MLNTFTQTKALFACTHCNNLLVRNVQKVHFCLSRLSTAPCTCIPYHNSFGACIYKSSGSTRPYKWSKQSTLQTEKEPEKTWRKPAGVAHFKESDLQRTTTTLSKSSLLLIVLTVKSVFPHPEYQKWQQIPTAFSKRTDGTQIKLNTH